MKYALLAVAASVALATSAVAKPTPTLISAKEVTQAIEQNLQYHAPQYIVLLDQTYPDAGVRDLVRAGLLEKDSTTNDCGQEWALSMTERGRSISWARGWSAYQDMLTIQAGSLRYIPNSANIFRYSGRPDAVRFQFQYVPDANAHALLRFGPARDWKTGDGFTLADAGRIYVKTVALNYNAVTGWYLTKKWRYRPSVIC